MIRALLYLAVALLLLVPSAARTDAHAVPASGDYFDYAETIVLDQGVGNYTGYTEATFINGSLDVTAAHANGTDAATYASTTHWSNNAGQGYTFPASGSFTFSAATFHYVQGTDNQTGYVDPYVWFFMNNSLPVGSTFYVLNTGLTVISGGESFPLATSSTGYVRTIFAEGNSSYLRDDIYGRFTASYTWQSYFDPATGYIVGYVYTETDRDAAGDGFTWTDHLHVTATSYPLTSGPAPPPPLNPEGANLLFAAIALAALAVVVIAVVAAIVVVHRRSRRAPLPQHAAPGVIRYDAPRYAGPAPINLTPAGQPAVQQIVVQETVKVNCRYCGALIDTTATNCPVCGAPRT